MRTEWGASRERGQDRLDLAPELASVVAARRFAAGALARWERVALADDTALVVTELVTNAVLHARTRLTLVLRAAGSGVRIEVTDTSDATVSRPPRAMEGPDDGIEAWLEGEAMTGRGLLVVESLADAWGVDTTDGAKTVWAELGTGRTGDHRAWSDPVVDLDAEDPDDGGPLAPGLHPVRLVGVPVRLALASDANLDDLIRELQVLTLAGDEHLRDLPASLIALVEEILTRYAPQRHAGRDVARRAAAAGQRLLDVGFQVPADAVADLWHLTSVLTEIADHCRQGTLLSLAPSDELMAFRRWYVAEVERQVGGQPPTPCPFPVVAPGPAAGRSGDPLLVVERSAREAAERSLARLVRLQRVAGELSRRLTVAEVADVIADQVMIEVGASTVSLCLLRPDGETVAIVSPRGYAEDVTTHWREFPASADLPASESIRTGEIVALRSVEERDERYPVFRDTPVVGDATSICVPLRVEAGRALGCIVVGFADERALSAEDAAFFGALAGHAAQALERARLHEAEAAALARLTFQAEASALLTASLDLHATLDTLTDLAVPRLGDWCSVHIPGPGGQPVLVAAAHVDPAKKALAEELNRRWPQDERTSTIHRALREGEPTLFQVIPDDVLAAIAHDEEHLRVLRELGFGSGAVLPLVGGGQIVGVLALANQAGRIVTADEYALAEDLAARAGAAVANARLFEERSHVAQALQASLLPARIEPPSFASAATRYVAAGTGSDVGGDFFDLFGTGDGYVVAIGDVCGKGVDAAALTGVARHTIRALARVEPSPAAILRELNDVLLQDVDVDLTGPLRFCTVALARLEPAGGGAIAHVCVAGHPRPIVRRRTGAAHEVGRTGSLLGVLRDVELSEVAVELEPGDSLVLFTDGVTERRSGPHEFFGVEGVASAVESAPPDAGADDLAGAVETAARAFGSGVTVDDMAIVVLTITA